MYTDRRTVQKVLESYGVFPRTAYELSALGWKRVATVLIYAMSRDRKNLGGFVTSALRYDWPCGWVDDFTLTDKWGILSQGRQPEQEG